MNRAMAMTALTLMTTAGCTRDIALLAPAPVGAADAGVPPRDVGAPAIDVNAADGADGADSVVQKPDADAGPIAMVTCAGPNAITLPTFSSATDVCAATLATRAYRFALCTCETLGVLQTLKTDVIDSSGAAVAGAAAAGIGVNTSLKATADVQVAGALYVAGAEGLTSTKTVVSAGSLRVKGPLQTARTETASDAFIGAAVTGFLSVKGRLHIADFTAIADGSFIGMGLSQEEISVPPPCPCDPNFVDIAGALATAAAHNDNQAVNLSPDRLTTVRASTAVDIPCGRFALSKIDADEAIFLVVHGRALLAVAGDVVLRGGLTVTLDPGAELDLLIGGALQAQGPYPLGASTAARFRIWVAGSGPVLLASAPKVGAMIYAPRAALTGDGAVDVSGALVARTALFSGPLNLHFDQAAFSSGEICGEPTAIAIP